MNIFTDIREELRRQIVVEGKKLLTIGGEVMIAECGKKFDADVCSECGQTNERIVEDV